MKLCFEFFTRPTTVNGRPQIMKFATQRILSWPIAIRGGLIHNQHPRRFLVIVDGEVAPFEDWNSQRLEVSRGYIGAAQFERFVGTWNISFGISIHSFAVEVERDPVCERWNRNSGQRCDAFENLVPDQRNFFICVARDIQPHGSGEDMILLEPRVGGADVSERTQKKSGGHEEGQ